MIKLTHHEMPVNKTLHHRKIEILAVLTLLIGSLSFLIYSYCCLLYTSDAADD